MWSFSSEVSKGFIGNNKEMRQLGLLCNYTSTSNYLWGIYNRHVIYGKCIIPLKHASI